MVAGPEESPIRRREILVGSRAWTDEDVRLQRQNFGPIKTIEEKESEWK